MKAIGEVTLTVFKLFIVSLLFFKACPLKAFPVLADESLGIGTIGVRVKVDFT